MTETEDKDVCPYCGHDKYKLVKGVVTFDETFYDKVCMKCGKKWYQ